jgi:tetratricopeptide (TPR) repeat protein/SAM-dependent methyltransferase
VKSQTWPKAVRRKIILVRSYAANGIQTIRVRSVISTGGSDKQATTLTVDQALRQAIACHQAGQLQDAERLYRAILQTQPHQPDANHNLGVLAAQVGQPAVGLPYLKTALALNPSESQYSLSYAEALLATGQAEEALNILQSAMQRGLNSPAIQALRQRAEAAANNTAPTPVEMGELVALFNAGRHAELESRARLLAERYPDSGFAWNALGISLQAQGKEPLTALQKAAELLPDDAGTHNNLANALKALGRLDDAVASYGRALAIKPDFAEAHYNLGVALKGLGKIEGAAASYRRALEINPAYAEAHNNLGIALQALGRLDDAIASYRRALKIKADFVEACNNLGIALQALGQFDDAVASYRQALELKADFADALNNLALLFNEKGESMMALDAIKQSLRIKETEESRSIFVACVKNSHFTHDDRVVRETMVRALTEPWGRPIDLARIGIDLVKLNPEIGRGVARAADAWPRRLSAKDLFGEDGLGGVAADPLLRALLDSAPICSIEMERFLTMARHAMLAAATGMAASDNELRSALSFYCALARQCFINEYVFAHTDGEIEEATNLRNSLAAALEQRTQVSALWPIAVAAYFPLCSLPLADRLFDSPWPEEVSALLTQQVREPEEEQRERASIPRLTSIEDGVSLLVQNQYEENPYPRWVRTIPAGKARNIVEYLRQKFPLATIAGQVTSGDIDILIAGCGTGQHSTGTAQKFQSARVLAIDLSMSSLSYAKRKTRELGMTSIEYAQADLVKLGSLNRSFDVIESSGVLHHLADPWAGWQVLLSLLRPGGFMNLGFYSAVARRNIVKARAFISEQGYADTADGIRRCRQDLIDLGRTTDFGTTLRTGDFFSISACRDLLFHVQEQRMTLTDIDAFLRENSLAFLGFDIDATVLHAYKLRFRDDRAATDLGQWQIFENENPDIFAGMYQFWIQKAA